jgi:FtsP/CotA-like multicopper oxidase with cupredoxin domain
MLALVAIAAAAMSMLVTDAPPASAQGSNRAVRPAFREPVTLATREGVLEVVLTARQGRAVLDTVAAPVSNFLLFDYELIRGTPSDGRTSGSGLYPAPTLQVFPGERLIVHLGNGLDGLAIRDFYNPQYTAKGATAPVYPEALTSSPLNLHIHGVHISPKGNADNVMLHIPAGMSNTYTYDVPANMPHGAYWYHSHLHGLTAAHVYMGLVGLLAIGRTDGNLPIVTQNRIPIRNMLLQYNVVPDRASATPQLINPNWPQFVSSFVPPKDDELARGTYRPLLAPVNFTSSPTGQKYFTVWFAGPLSIYNQRGLLQFMPASLQRFTARGEQRDKDVPDNPSLPDHERDVQYTVNGQFQPVLESKAGQTEIWVLANVSDFAYMSVQLTEDGGALMLPSTAGGFSVPLLV